MDAAYVQDASPDVRSFASSLTMPYCGVNAGFEATAWLDEPGWPDPRPNPDCRFRLLVRKAVAPTDSEISRNPRARSSKLRVAELLAPL